jgi:zinc protease
LKRPYTKILPKALLAAGALGLSTLPVARAQDGAAKANAAAVTVPKLDYKEARLPNGLKVVTLEDHRAPVVTLQVWYHVGSKDEAQGKAGFAHLFEHLMFKGSEHVGPQEHSRYIEQIGGDYNANTSFDRTLYYETVPSNALERMLYLEADRMRSLRVDDPNLKSERSVVEEEHRLRVDNAPYGTLLESIQALVYPPKDPYEHTTIGILADLDSAVLKDVQAFHDEYYKPDNATLVLVGDFKTDEAIAKITKYFGGVPKSTKPFTRYPAIASDQTAERRKTVYDKLAPLPMVVMAYRLPATEGPDARDLPVFDVMSRILSVGNSSRLYRSLVRDQQIAVEAQGDALNLKLGGVFFFLAVANAGKAPDVIEKSLTEQAELLRTQPVSQAELDKAKNQVISGKVLGEISTEAKANALGEADLLYGTPAEANKELSELQAVTAADIQRVAQKYFAPDRRNVLYMLPASMQKSIQKTSTQKAAKAQDSDKKTSGIATGKSPDSATATLPADKSIVRTIANKEGK